MDSSIGATRSLAPIATAVGFMIAFASCTAPRAQMADVNSAARSNDPHAGPLWSYEGATGPESWGSLSSEFSLCAAGHKQSPINITAAVVARLQALQFEYHPARAVVTNNGHTVQASFAPGNSVRVGNDQYSLLQFHYHHPSEHLIGDVALPLEVHLVHRNAAGQLAVVGVLFEEGGTPNAALNAMLQAEPKEVGREATVQIDPAELLPQDHSYFTYDGSLTTPPCSEAVKWIVLGARESVTHEQIIALQHLVAPNARPVQKIGDKGIRASAPQR
jgi:carbonic anhydrase